MTYHPNAESLVRVCDVVTINTPLHPETEHMFDDALIAKMKRGADLVNTARAKICDRDAIARALRARAARGIRGRRVVSAAADPRIIPWRTMPYQRDDAAYLGDEPLGSGALRGRHARDSGMLVRGRPIREEYLIVAGGKLAGAVAHSYSPARTPPGGAEEAR